jgi:hypothetical protein
MGAIVGKHVEFGIQICALFKDLLVFSDPRQPFVHVAIPSIERAILMADFPL